MENGGGRERSNVKTKRKKEKKERPGNKQKLQKKKRKERNIGGLFFLWILGGRG